MSKFIYTKHRSPVEIQALKQALRIIGDRWSGLILLCLFQEPQRFGDIQAFSEGISPKTLSRCLQTLEKAGLITKQEFKEFPPRTKYSVTPKALALKKVLISLKKWASQFCCENENHKNSLS